MQSPLQKKLAEIAPNIAIETIWDHDPYMPWDIEDPSLNPDDFMAWQVEVRASAIHKGQMVSESAYLGGCWEEVGKAPKDFDPEINGYERQMTIEALHELLGFVKDVPVLVHSIMEALDYLDKN
jgi:hypothetical protein